MNWFEGIEENTLVKVELDNGKDITFYFIKISNGIVEGKLENGKIKKFKEDKIEDLEELDINSESIEKIPVSKESQQIIQNIIQKQKVISSPQTKVPHIKTSFLNKIDNSILTPIEFDGKNSLIELKKESKNLYSTVMNIVNQFNHATKIKELDFKFGRSQKIIKQLDALLSEDYYEEIDIFLAYALHEADVSYFEFFKKYSEYIYCLKHDIYFYNMKNNKYGFIIAEKLFELYYLDGSIEAEWLYTVKNIQNFNSIKVFEYQYEYFNKLDKERKNLLSESINYIFNKVKIDSFSNDIWEQIKILKNTLIEANEYKNLNYINGQIQENKISSSIINLTSNNTSFSSLGDSFLEIMQPKIEKELKKILPPNGIIKTYFNDGRDYGFIKDKKGNESIFYLKNIIDKDLVKELKSSEFPNHYIEVCFSISYNYKGEVAEAIQKPKQIKTILDEVLKYKENNHLDIAQKILEQILIVYPDNLKVKQLYNEIINTKPFKKYSNYNQYENYSGYGSYRKAKDAKDRKDYETAIKYFKIALGNNERIDSTIKDLVSTYYEMGDVENAKKVLFENGYKLSQNITTYNFLQHYYYTLKEYNKSIEYADIILKNTYNRNKEVILLAKKATCYIKLNNKNEAKKLLKEILNLQKDNNYAKKLLEEIETGKSLEDIDISSFGGGLSQFIRNTLNNYEDYSGIPPKVVESQDFTEGTLKEIRRIIKDAGKARPKERANYLLTEAKLMQILEPNKDNNRRSVLARYCNAMALNHISENSSKDIIKFYYLEAFNLEEEWSKLARQVSFFLLTYIRNYRELLNTRSPSLDDVLSELIFSENKQFWNGIIDMFIWNETITKYLIKKLYDEKNFMKKSLEFLSLNGIIISNNNLQSFTKKWDSIREKRKRDYDDWFIKIRTLLKINHLEALSSQMKEILIEIDKDWLSQTDKYRLNTLNDISNILGDYLKEKTFDDRERTKNYLITKINELIEEINKLPTKFSYEGYKNILSHIEKLVLISFDGFLKASKPIVNIELLGESVAINNKNVSLQLAIHNSKDSSPISNIKLEVINTDDIKFKKGNMEIYESIRGSETKIIKIDIEVSDRVISNLATDMKINLNYHSRATNEVIKQIHNIAIRLYPSEEFEKIINPYSPIAEGGPVKDETMFYGRDEYIENIVNSLITSNAKSIIIYGQKRSGKSSVLHFLKKYLLQKENAFCIEFTMGDTIEDSTITLFAFYNKILEQIEEELEYLESDGYDVPFFQKPSISELKEYPQIVFDNSLKNFNKSLKKIDSWRNKKLVILIDEFTYVYSSIEKEELSPNFMKSWKAFIEKNYFSAVLIGQDVAPKFKQKYPNEFGVTEDKRLTYLSEEDARKLIEEPIWDKERDSSRYIGKAINKIIDYTACSPYYLQMFCARVVDYMNRKKAISVTESDVEEIANSFIEGAECLSKDKFDNLFTAGDADIEAFDLNDVEDVLIQIAKKTNIGSCSREDINIENREKKVIDDILNDLVSREVIQQKENFYQIKVGLFKKWLLKQ